MYAKHVSGEPLSKTDGFARLLVLQRDLSSLSLPSTLAIDLKRTLSMGTIGRIVSHLMIPDDFKSPIEIKNRLPQGDGQQ
jgi:hypothetical protein